MSIFSKIGKAAKDVLGAVAPTLASALPGPLGSVAKAALAAALGVDADDRAIEKAIVAADPEVLLKLRQAEQDFKTKMKELDVDLEKVHSADRHSARLRQIKLKDPVPAVLAGITFAGFAAIIYVLLRQELPPGNREVILMVLGSVSTLVASVSNFYFGSSEGSKRKTEALSARDER